MAVYTGKIMADLIGMVRAGAFAKDQSVLFIHNRGMPLLFASTATSLEKLPWWTSNEWTRPMTHTGKCHRGRVGIGPVVETNNRREDETEK